MMVHQEYRVLTHSHFDIMTNDVTVGDNEY